MNVFITLCIFAIPITRSIIARILLVFQVAALVSWVTFNSIAVWYICAGFSHSSRIKYCLKCLPEILPEMSIIREKNDNILKDIIIKIWKDIILIFWTFLVPECERDPDCLTTRYCELTNNTCAVPCIKWPCGPNAYGTNINHRCLCRCIEGYTGDPTGPGGCGKFRRMKCIHFFSIIFEL